MGVSVPEDVGAIFRTDLPIQAAMSLFMDTCVHAPLVLLMMQDPKLLTLCGC
jgi:hypothetical protein